MRRSDLARDMGTTTVAEGVENSAQHDQVAALGCDLCQGFYFAQPMSATDFDTVTQLGDRDGNLRLPVLVT